MVTFTTKPHNDPWETRARKDPQYKIYCAGHHDASRMSWRRIKKMFTKDEAHRSTGRAERRILRATAEYRKGK